MAQGEMALEEFLKMVLLCAYAYVCNIIVCIAGLYTLVHMHVLLVVMI